MLTGTTTRSIFGFQKCDEVKDHYKKLCEKADAEHDKIYRKALNHSTNLSSIESMPRVIRGRQTKPHSEFTI